MGCWGDNSNGQLGTGATVSRDSIAWIPSAQLPEIASLSGNPSMVRMCGLSRAGHAYCWGDGAQFFSSTPVFVRSLTPVRFIDGTYTRIRQRIEGDWLHAVCLESSATSDAAAGTKCYGQASASSYQGHLYTNTITNMIGFTSAQGAGYISGSSVLWALGVIVGEAGGTGSPIVKAVDYLRLTSSGTLYGMRFNPVQGVSNRNRSRG